MEAAAFYIFGGLTVISALGVAASRNIVRAAVWLLFALAGIAALYMNLAADFLAATQVLVYVGGVLVLMIFGVMLTSRSPFVKFEPRGWELGLAAALALGLLVVLAVSVQGIDWDAVKERSLERKDWAKQDAAHTTHKTLAQISDVNKPVDQPLDNTRDLGWALLTDRQFLLPFYLSSVHLLVVMIGAAWLARSRRAA